jgi:cell division protein FtsB
MAQRINLPAEGIAQGALMFDLARKATDYQWQALKHEEQALRARNANLKNGFAALAQMCEARAAQLKRHAELRQARRSA